MGWPLGRFAIYVDHLVVQAWIKTVEIPLQQVVEIQHITFIPIIWEYFKIIHKADDSKYLAVWSFRSKYLDDVLRKQNINVN
ncbi:MAG: hypothetical protein M3Q44_05535 [bacterium]|nr:hypothetical protein [bacterium]